MIQQLDRVLTMVGKGTVLHVERIPDHSLRGYARYLSIRIDSPEQGRQVWACMRDDSVVRSD